MQTPQQRQELTAQVRGPRAVGFSLAIAECTESRGASSQADLYVRALNDTMRILHLPRRQKRDSSGAKREEDESGSMGWVDWRGRDWRWRGHLKGCCKISFLDKELS